MITVWGIFRFVGELIKSSVNRERGVCDGKCGGNHSLRCLTLNQYLSIENSFFEKLRVRHLKTLHASNIKRFRLLNVTEIKIKGL